MWRLAPQSRAYFSGALVPSESPSLSVSLVEVAEWCFDMVEAVCRVCWLWGLSGDADPRQSPPSFCPEPPSTSYKATCRRLLLVLGLELPRRGQAANQGRLPLVPGLGPLSKRYRAC